MDTPRAGSTGKKVRRGMMAGMAPPSTTASTLSSVDGFWLVEREGERGRGLRGKAAASVEKESSAALEKN
jgi:hypothetical protein